MTCCAACNESLATQKRFLADAAHQLKTPLAGLRMQADLAQREGTSTEELKRSLQHIGRSSIRATHTVNQLLALARAEGSGAGLQRQPCDLAELTIEVVRDSVPRAMDKHIDLGYDGAEPGAPGVQLQRQPHAAQGAGAQPGGQRHQLHPVHRRKAGRGHGPRAGRHLWPGADAAGGRLGPRRARGRARAGLSALLPGPGHARPMARAWACPS